MVFGLFPHCNTTSYISRVFQMEMGWTGGLVGGLVDRLVNREGDPSLMMFVVGSGGQG